jgi:serine/threonine-protein kinase
MPIAKTTRLGPYKMLSPLGSGGMGEVYLAEDSRLHRKVALKILPDELASDRNRMNRFNQEAMAAAALNHPHIAHIYEIGTAEGVHFIAMEYIDGHTLRHQIDERTKLPEILEIVSQVSSALVAAHEASIIHRDIKPENIMVRRDGYSKLLDFGLAKLSEPQGTPVDTDAPTKVMVNTTSSTVVGTANYMSPEQAKGIPLDARTDLWSLGVVLYEMVTGQLPFRGETTAETLSLILQREPTPLSRFAHDLPAELERIVTKALTKDCEERYQSAKDLLIDLRNLKRKLEVDAEIERTGLPNPRQFGSTSSGAPANTLRSLVSALSRDATVSSNATPILLNIRQPKLLALIIAALLTLAALISAYLYFGRTRRGAIDSIAVLPLINVSSNSDTEYLSDGISESLINSLSQLPGVKVIASTSSLRYKGKEVDLKEVARTLGVEAILTGRVSQRDDNLLINVELIRAEDKTQIWGEQYDRKATDLLSVQREIASEIISNLRLKLSGAEQGRVTKHYTENPEAYQLYLKGRFYWNKRTGDAAKKAVEYFQQAIQIDPNYALAYAGLADAYQLLTLFADRSPAESFPKAKEMAKRALELDETLAEAHTSLASTLFFYDRNYPEAEREYRRAIQLNPNYATAHHWYGVTYLAKMERFEEAIAELKQAQELDPLSLPINADVGNTYIQARQYDKGIEQLRKTVEMDQNFYVAHMFLGMAYQMKGNFQDAIAEYQKARQLNDDPFVLALLGDIYAVSGRKDEALKILDQLKQLSKQRFVYAYGVALVYVGLGDKDQAFQWLEKSFQDHEARINRLKVDPLFDRLRSDARYAELIHRIGLS